MNPSKRREELRALTRLVDTFDATILIHMKQHFERGTVQRAADRIRVDDQIDRQHATCTLRHDDHQPLHPAWPNPVATHEGRYAIVCPPPAKQDWQRGEIGWSPTVRALTDTLNRAGAHRHHVTLIPVVGCRPTDATGRPRTLVAAEVAQHARLVRQAIDAADVRYVLFYGAHAARAWRPDLDIRQTAGRFGIHNREQVAFVLREPPSNTAPLHARAEWAMQVERFAEAVTTDSGLTSLDTTCIHCHTPLFAYDPQGIALCETHFNKWDKGDKAVAKALKASPDPNQETMFG